MSAVPVARPWRRFLRFSVRWLIVLVLVIGAGLSWLVRSARIQREAVAAIEKAGGEVHFDWERKNGTVVPGGKLWEPARFVKLLGVDYFGHVTYVTFATRGQLAKPTRELLAHLGEVFRQSAELDDVQFSMREATSCVPLLSTSLTDDSSAVLMRRNHQARRCRSVMFERTNYLIPSREGRL